MPEQRLGDILKAKREQKRLSLHSIHQETRISVNYLDALETGKWSVFPAEVYLTGFLRKYSAYLGLNPDEMVGLYRKEQEKLVAKKSEEAEGKAAEKPKPPEESTTVVQGAIFGVLVLALAGWLGYNLMKSAAKQNRVKEEPPRVAATVPAPQPAPESEDLSLSLTALDSVWVRVLTDEQLALEGFIAARSTRTFSADEQISLRIGNVNSVRLALNGRPINPQVGSVKSVGELVLTRKSLTDPSLTLGRSTPSSPPASTSPAPPERPVGPPVR